MNEQRRILLALFALGFGIRILYASLAGFDPSINPKPFTSEAEYGWTMAQGTEWVAKALSPRAPGYPMFLAPIFLVTGKHVWPIIVAQSILGGLLTLLLYALGRSIGGHQTGLVSALWMAIFPHHVYLTAILTRDALSCFLLVLLVNVLTRPFKRMRWSLVAAAIYAYLVHVDPRFLWLFPVLFAYVLFFLTRHRLINLQYLVLFTSFSIIISVPWTVRNYLVYDQLVAVSLEASRYITPVKRRLPAKIRAIAERTSPPVSRSRLARMEKNAAEFWRIARFGPEDNGGEKAWSTRHNLLSIFSYGILLPFSLIGLVWAFWRRNPPAMLAGSVTLMYFLICLVFGGSEKARLQVEPFVVLLAFYAIWQLKESFSTHRQEVGGT